MAQDPTTGQFAPGMERPIPDGLPAKSREAMEDHSALDHRERFNLEAPLRRRLAGLTVVDPHGNEVPVDFNLIVFAKHVLQTVNAQLRLDDLDRVKRQRDEAGRWAADADFEEVVALFLMLPEDLRGAAGLPRTQRALEEEFGKPKGTISHLKKRKKFHDDQITNGWVLDKARQGIGPVVDNILAIASDPERATAAMAKLALTIGQVITDGKKPGEVETTASLKPMTPEEQADEWAPKMLATEGGRRLVASFGGTLDAEQAALKLIRQMVVGLFSGRRSATERRQEQERAALPPKDPTRRKFAPPHASVERRQLAIQEASVISED